MTPPFLRPAAVLALPGHSPFPPPPATQVVLTTCSTVMACVLTPLLVMFLAGSLVPINGAALGADVLKVCPLREERTTPASP
jgi:hypothetical protein